VDKIDKVRAVERSAVSNLPYRRFPIGKALQALAAAKNSGRSQAGSTAIQQVGNLRYDFVRLRCTDSRRETSRNR